MEAIVQGQCKQQAITDLALQKLQLLYPQSEKI